MHHLGCRWVKEGQPLVLQNLTPCDMIFYRSPTPQLEGLMYADKKYAIAPLRFLDVCTHVPAACSQQLLLKPTSAPCQGIP